ncbi:MAG: 30S ribosomal protein S16 [Caldilineaceae bacterium]|nr:30S ribosomal protein S16 [Caldilineaceae bacterium]
MVRIRLRRMGAKKKPFYRVVVADQRNARNGRFIENIGTYDPLSDPPTINIQGDRATQWLLQGAQPSDAVARLLKKIGVLGEDGSVIAPAETPAEIAAEAPAETPEAVAA